MSVAKVLEITATSEEGFEDAARKGIAKARETVRDLKVTFVLD
jgi:flavin-binding protein dodecin